MREMLYTTLVIFPLFSWTLANSLALYYLNTTSKGYQQANIDLKRKMQMVSMVCPLLSFKVCSSANQIIIIKKKKKTCVL